MADMELITYLKRSEAIRLVIDGKYTPKDLDNSIKNMRRRIEELQTTHQLDMAEIALQRRQIDFLMEGKENRI